MRVVYPNDSRFCSVILRRSISSLIYVPLNGMITIIIMIKNSESGRIFETRFRPFLSNALSLIALNQDSSFLDVIQTVYRWANRLRQQ
jgi:hypothetical protein